MATTPVFVWGLIKTYKTYGTYSDLLQKNAKKVASPMQYFAFYCIYRVEPRKNGPTIVVQLFSNFVISKIDTDKNAYEKVSIFIAYRLLLGGV